MDIEGVIVTMQEERDRLAGETLKLRDQLDDLLSGFECWKTYKTQSMELSTLDEMLIRYVEHADVN